MRLLMIVEIPDTLLQQAAAQGSRGKGNIADLAPFRVGIEWGVKTGSGWVEPNGYVSRHEQQDGFRILPAIHDLPEQVADRVAMRLGDQLAAVFKRFGLRDVSAWNQLPPPQTLPADRWEPCNECSGRGWNEK